MENSAQPITNEEQAQVSALRVEYKRVAHIYNQVDEGHLSVDEGLEQVQLKHSQLAKYSFIEKQLNQYLTSLTNKDSFIPDKKEQLLNYFIQVQRYFSDMVDILE